MPPTFAGLEGFNQRSVIVITIKELGGIAVWSHGVGVKTLEHNEGGMSSAITVEAVPVDLIARSKCLHLCTRQRQLRLLGREGRPMDHSLEYKDQ